MLFEVHESLSQKENKKQAKQIADIIKDCLCEDLRGERLEAGMVVAAYALYEVRKAKGLLTCEYEALFDSEIDISDDLKETIRHMIKAENWKKLVTRLSEVSEEEFAEVIFLPTMNSGFSTERGTPTSIVKLTQAMLRCKSDDRVADICCGVGNFLLSTAEQEKNAIYTGYDINVDVVNIARIRSKFIDADIEINLQNVFNIGLEKNSCFDKIFANYPFSMTRRKAGYDTSYLKSLEGRIPGVLRGSSPEWVFNALMIDLLKQAGKAVAIMPVGCLWRTSEKSMRRYFIEKGYIEALIALPPRMFASTSITTTLIVLSRGNTSVRFVDASDICQYGRRQNEFSDEDINTIVKALLKDSEYSKTVSVDEIREEEYNLDFNRYFNNIADVKNGVEFDSVIKRITRGAPLTAKQLDQLVTKEMTDMQYLMLANIQDGVLQNDLPYLSKIEPKYEKYCLKNNDLILSKNGFPYKVAVAEIGENQKVLANGNLYIIELDQDKVNPYYLKAFFDSEQGLAALRGITAGVALPNISMDNLKKLIVPLPELSVQNRIAQKYQAIMDEIAVYKLKMEKAENRLHHVFEEESGE